MPKASPDINTIAYQNKDITSKILAEGLKEKSFSVYGIPVPKIVQVLPTNLPAIEANELRMDNLFLLADKSYALVDYESSYSDADKIKYAGYITRTLKRLRTEGIKRPHIRMIVLYTSNIEHVNTVLDVGSLRLTIEPGYLVQINTEEIFRQLIHKTENQEELTAEELMQLIILPLTVKSKYEQQNMLYKCVDLAKSLCNEYQLTFALSGLITFSDKIIDPEYADTVRRWIQMTKVGLLFEMEKQEAIKDVKAQTALNLSAMGMTADKIAQALNENIVVVQEWLTGLTPAK